MQSYNSKVERAIEIIKDFDGGVVALSAGVDSSLVALIAKRALGDRIVAVTGVSPSLPPGELGVAKKTAEEVGIPHLTVETDEMENESYTSNPVNRCYHCKSALYLHLRYVADRMGLEAIFDGTQVDDMSDTRPGFQAAKEAGVVSPLLLAGFTKEDVRNTAKQFGLSVWDKPAMPCLSSRIPHGQSVTVDKLAMIGQAEAFIKSMVKVRNLRVRCHENYLARIEIGRSERQLLLNAELFDKVDAELRRIGFNSVTLDLKGYSRPRKEEAGLDVALPMATS